ncbi:MarR family transcriptional regulator [Streptomyces sp. NPDC085946]|uniref:MarR family transcriptional regulator n=1 Tax=Streptomyces sp. NPDC085946 TaxID=3365744 RepID=UPI0037D91D93
MTEPRAGAGREAAHEDVSRLWERLVPMFSLLQGQLDRVLTNRHGVGLAPLMALGALVRARSGSATVGDVARRLSVSASAASRMLAQLERSGWVARVEWPCDRRISRVAATEQGRGVWARASRTLDDELHTRFSTLRFDEKYAHVVARLCRAEGDPPGPRPPQPPTA